MRDHWHLTGQDFFHDLEETKLAFLALAKRRDLAKGAMVFHEDDPASSCFYLEKGAVKIHRVSALGKEPIFFIRKAGEAFGLAEVIGGQSRKASAQAIQPSVLHELGRAELDHLLAESPQLSRRIIQVMGARLRFLGDQVEGLMAANVATRLLKVLAALSFEGLAKTETPVPVALTQEQMANLCGSCQQTISETLKRLQDEGYIRFDRKGVVLLKPLEILENILA